MKLSIEKAVTWKNDAVAGELRQQFAQNSIFCLNVIAAPGAGKTTLIEKTIEGLSNEFDIMVIEGDPHTRLDSDRVTALGANAKQINTLGGCHLDANMIKDALCGRNLDRLDLLIIENIGNLLCPAAWDLGEDTRLLVASLPEGSDKSIKYPETFILSQVMVINKIDLEPFLPVKTETIRRNALLVNPNLSIFEVSCLKGTGLDAWLDWVRTQCLRRRKT